VPTSPPADPTTINIMYNTGTNGAAVAVPLSLVALLVALALGLIWRRRRLSRPKQRVRAKPIPAAQLSVDSPAITSAEANELQSSLQDLLIQPWKEWFPRVAISYATGTRKIDAKGSGPGMCWAARVIQALNNAGIDCASGLHVPPGANWKVRRHR